MTDQILGLRYHQFNLDQTISIICSAIDEGKKIIRTDVNVGAITSSQHDAKLRDFLNSGDIINMDGAGAILGARFLGLPVPERITGVDLFLKLLEISETNRYSVYFLGSTKETLRELRNVIKEKFPKLIISGSHDGYFWGQEEKVITDINSCQPNILFVGIKSPEKEYFQADYADKINSNLIMGVGGSFDVVSGKVSRAPAWIQQIYLEWAYRIYQEPKRMFKRYMISNFLFGKLLIQEKMLHKKA